MSTPSFTSAAAKVSLSVTVLEDRVLEAVAGAGVVGMTAYELAAATGLSWQTVSPRIRPLERKKKVVRIGDTRIAGSDRQQLIVRAAEYVTAEVTARVLAGMPVAPVKRRGPYLKGLVTAAKLLIETDDLATAKRQLFEIIKTVASKA